MKNRYLKELNNLKKLPFSRLYSKKFSLPNLTISSTYQNFSKEVFQVMDDIYQDLKIDHLISGLLQGKEIIKNKNKSHINHTQYTQITLPDFTEFTILVKN